MMIMTSEPLPGLPTVRPPPLTLVTDNLAILHRPPWFHLVMNLAIDPTLIFPPGTSRRQPGWQPGELLRVSRWSRASGRCREWQGSQPSVPQTWTLELIPMFCQPLAAWLMLKNWNVSWCSLFRNILQVVGFSPNLLHSSKWSHYGHALFLLEICFQPTVGQNSVVENEKESSTQTQFKCYFHGIQRGVFLTCFHHIADICHQSAEATSCQ